MAGDMNKGFLHVQQEALIHALSWRYRGAITASAHAAVGLCDLSQSQPTDANLNGRPQRARLERLTAEMMAFNALVVMEESMPTPQTICVSSASPTWHST